MSTPEFPKDYVFIIGNTRWYISPNLMELSFVNIEEQSNFPNGFMVYVELTTEEGYLGEIYDREYRTLWCKGKDYLPPQKQARQRDDRQS